MDGYSAFSLEKTVGFVTNPMTGAAIDARDIVNSRFTDVTAYITAATTDFDAAVADLKAAGGAIPVDSIAASGITQPDWAALGITIPDFTKTFTEVFDAEMPTFSATLSVPENKPSSSVTWQDATIGLDTQLVAAVAGWLETESSAIPEAVQTAIYNAAVTRLNETKALARLEFEDKLSARGFTAPPGVLDDALIRFDAEFAKGAADISAKIAERDMELTQANIHKALDIAQAYVAAAQQYNIEKNKFMLAAMEKAVDMWLKEYDAAIKEFEAHATVFKAQADAYKVAGDVFETQGKVYESESKAYVAQVEGVKAKADYYINQVRIAIERYKADSEVDMKEAELKVMAKYYEYMLKEKIAEGVAGVYAQTISSGFSGLHVSAGISANRSDALSVGYNFGYSESLSEGHSETTQQIATESAP